MAARTGMPMIQPVDPTALVWRYMDLAKLVSLLSTSRLYLARMEELVNDWHEGRLPSHAEQKIISGPMFLNGSMNVNWAQRQRRERALQARRVMCVNSWCRLDREDAGLWAQYAEGSTGVALRGRYCDLVNALPDAVSIGLVRYFDPDSQELHNPDLWSVATSKRNQFQAECECRIVAIQRQRFSQSNPGRVEPPEPCYVEIDLVKAALTVVTNPQMPDWQHFMVEPLVRAFDRPLTLERSRMRPTAQQLRVTTP